MSLFKQMERFLIFGSECGTYYISEPELSPERSVPVLHALRLDGARAVQTIADIASSGRAPRNTPALFALALASAPRYADADTNARALAALPGIARNAQELSTFIAFARTLRGWGRGLRSAVAAWYASRPVAALVSQIAQSSGREGWSHRDLLRAAHVQPSDDIRSALFRWAREGIAPDEDDPAAREGA